MDTNESALTIEGLTVTVRYKRGLRRINMRLTGPNTALVTAPPRTPEKYIRKLIAQNKEWISTQQQKQLRIKQMPQAGALLFGKSYRTEVRHSDTLPRGCNIVEDTIIVNPLHDGEGWTEDAVSTFTSMIKKIAGEFLPTRLAFWADKMDISYTSISLREQSSRWGSCSSTGSINLNWRLVHAPTTVIDYVLIHELAHRVHLNHSAAFWHLVEQYDPEHKTHRGWLRREGGNLL